MNYHKNFLQFYIEDEMEIYGKVFAKWEDCDEKFAKLGSALTYPEFEQVDTRLFGGFGVCKHVG